ncbi:hypothetical protein [Novosphingobium album (ex Hu et al. 2023)]|uniref:Uncharacterized protein n=1 Tax=Novosphingobium album (ex Hu et al. 2023) TaxID=2930093 RepID=A0ABT0B850_9SPHN|nr:hypothetical protein [Novosphingobium album (ex Hu et al. 2023)]MCJ2181089.1 hypothetical protein [Novosphingobium album (ex Hu et al. 2023)]
MITLVSRECPNTDSEKPERYSGLCLAMEGVKIAAPQQLTEKVERRSGLQRGLQHLVRIVNVGFTVPGMEEKNDAGDLPAVVRDSAVRLALKAQQAAAAGSPRSLVQCDSQKPMHFHIQNSPEDILETESMI